MREVVDHYFPPVNTLVKGGGEEYTDFTYWREPVLDIDDFSDSESDEKDDQGNESEDEEDEEDDDEGNDELGDSYISRDSIDDDNYEHGLDESMLSGSVDEDEAMTNSMLEADGDDAEDSGRDDTVEFSVSELPPVQDSQRDIDAEVITGMKGLRLEREDSEDKKV